MDEQPNDAGGGKPGPLNNMTAWIGGATALVVALGGLATATGNLWPKKESAPTSTEESASSAPSTAQDASASNAAEADEGYPSAYNIDGGGTLSWVEGMWVWTDENGTKNRFTEQSSSDVTTIALLKGGGEGGEDIWLRWPTPGGGQLQKSIDNQANWTDVGEVTEDTGQEESSG